MNALNVQKRVPIHWQVGHSKDRQLAQEPQSQPGKVLYDFVDKIHGDRIITVTNPPDDVRLTREHAQIIAECSKENWDNYGAKPIARESVDFALQLLDKLPPSVPYPSLIAEPTGELGLLWENENSCFTLAFNIEGRSTYAGKTGNGRVFGSVDPVAEEAFAKAYSEVFLLISSVYKAKNA